MPKKVTAKKTAAKKPTKTTKKTTKKVVKKVQSHSNEHENFAKFLTTVVIALSFVILTLFFLIGKFLYY